MKHQCSNYLRTDRVHNSSTANSERANANFEMDFTDDGGRSFVQHAYVKYTLVIAFGSHCQSAFKSVHCGRLSSWISFRLFLANTLIHPFSSCHDLEIRSPWRLRRLKTFRHPWKEVAT